MTIDDFHIKLVGLIQFLEKETTKGLIKEQNKDTFTDMNKGQLWDGKTNKGFEIKPFHSQSKYFKTKEKAEKYIKWKESFSASIRRRPDVPNLFINGKFYSEIKTNITNQSINFDAKGKMSPRILPVFDDILGLTAENAGIITTNLVEVFKKPLNDYFT